MPLNFLSLTSGGKDSHFSAHLACLPPYNHNIVGYVHISPKSLASDAELADRNSHMFQSACSKVVTSTLSKCTGLPVYVLTVSNSSSSNNVERDYIPSTSDDEIEILYNFLSHLQTAVIPSLHPGLPLPNALCTGATLSTYQRTRIESITTRLNWTSISPMWRQSPFTLYKSIIATFPSTIVCKVATIGMSEKHVGKELGDLNSTLHALNEKFGVSVVGEGGEFETLVLDGPAFVNGRAKLTGGEKVVEDGAGAFILVPGMVGFGVGVGGGGLDVEVEDKTVFVDCDSFSVAVPHTSHSNSDSNATTMSVKKFQIRSKSTRCGLVQFSDIRSSTNNSSPTSQISDILAILKYNLLQQNLSPLDAISCVLHLPNSTTSAFSEVNKIYSNFFGTVYPGSRVCIALASPKMSLSVTLLRNSGSSLREIVAGSHRDPPLRVTLDVSSISSWAPVCIGPYSQASVVRGGFNVVSGMIGLRGGDMELENGFEAQLRRCWTSLASVLDALDGGCLEDSLGAVVYVAEEAMKGDGVGVGRVREICGECVGNNGGILPGLAEGKLCLNNVPETETEIETGGYEDFETWVEIEGIDAVNEELKRLGNENNDQESSPFHLPITVLVVPELPKMALVEVELAGGVANARASKILGGVKESSQEFVNNDNGAIKVLDGGWDLGYNSTIQGSMLKTKAKINAKTKTRIRLLEKCMCAVWGTTTTVEEGEGDVTFEELETCLLKIFGAMANSVKNEAMMNSSESCLSVRLWHKFDEEGVVKDAAQRALGRVSGLEEAALSIAKVEQFEVGSENILFESVGVFVDTIQTQTEVFIQNR